MLKKCLFILCLTGPLLAQSGGLTPTVKPVSMFAVNAPITTLGPDAALQRYIEHRQEQSSRLPSYESETSVHAELPDSAQHGDYELIANYRADPRALNYVSVHFEGDRFVKSNIILRILQSEADHVRKKDDGSTAINEQNYKFSYAGIEQVHNRQAHVFHLKPRRKKPGLFKGQISLDASTGSMLRMEGTLVKSPSMFVRDINFVQDFEEFEGFTLPTELHSWARARFIGRTMVNIVHRSYKLQRDSERAHRQLPEREISDRGSGTN